MSGSQLSQATLTELAGIVGAEHVLSHTEDTAAYLTDARRQYSTPAGCVVRPASTAEVAQVVSCCAQNRIGIVPQGGNTGLSGGSVPAGPTAQIVLSTGRMNRIRALDTRNSTLTVEAGCILAAIQETARQAGLLFPLSLAAEGSCQIGGNLSTNAGGVNVLRYGNAREQVLGLEVVLPDGRIWDGLRGLRKDNTGYDLKHLFIGSEGTLGVITAAVLRLRPLPLAEATAWAAVASPNQAVAWLSHLRVRLGERIVAYELISRACVEAVLARIPQTRDPLDQPYPWYVLVQLADTGPGERLAGDLERAFQEALDERMVLDIALASSSAQAAALWKIRETIPEAQFRNVKHDVSVPVSSVPELLESAGAALERAFPGMIAFAFGHLGDGNIHYNVGMRDAAATERLIDARSRVNRIVFDEVARLDGSISAEHGLGQLKRDTITHYKNPLELEMMRTIKRTFDPQGIMNPGKVILI